MGNDVMKMPGVGSLAAGLKKTKAALPSFGGKGYLKFGKDGEWSLGRNGDALNGSVVVLNVNSYETGFVCWTNYPDSDGRKNEKMGEEMQSVALGAVDVTELADYGWPWKPQMSIEGRQVGGDKAEFNYSTSSEGGLEWLDTIFTEVLERIEGGEEVYLYPMIRLEDDHYIHNKWGKIYKPAYTIVGWADMQGNPEGDPVAQIEDEADEQPKKKKDKKKYKKDKKAEEPEVPEDTSEETEEVPVVRRRRR